MLRNVHNTSARALPRGVYHSDAWIVFWAISDRFWERLRSSGRHGTYGCLQPCRLIPFGNRESHHSFCGCCFAVGLQAGHPALCSEL